MVGDKRDAPPKTCPSSRYFYTAAYLSSIITDIRYLTHYIQIEYWKYEVLVESVPRIW